MKIYEKKLQVDDFIAINQNKTEPSPSLCCGNI